MADLENATPLTGQFDNDKYLQLKHHCHGLNLYMDLSLYDAFIYIYSGSIYYYQVNFYSSLFLSSHITYLITTMCHIKTVPI